jgi:flagellar hook-associated protein 3 FlgL
MRVTNNTYPDTLLRHLQRITKQMNSLQEQAANGQRITDISDDSAAGNRILDMQEEKGKLTQYSKNASRAQNINNTTISQLQNFIRISDRISEISTLANDLKGSDGLRAYAEEVDELIEHALQGANAKFNGEYVFGGIASGSEPFSVNLDADGKSQDPDGAGAGTAITYVGASKGPEFHLSESGKVSPFTEGTTNQQFANFINRMVGLRDALESGNQNAVTSSMRDGLESSEDDLIFALSRQGSVQLRIEFDLNLNQQRFMDLEENISSEADVDLSQTIVRLTQIQNSYQASLQSAGKVLNSSLLNYI